MNESLKTFAEAIKSNIEAEPAKLFWRLYYDPATGKGLFMSMEDVEGSWVDITREQYDTLRLDYIAVQEGSVVEFDPTQLKHRLRPGTPAVYTVHSEEHSLPVVESDTPNHTTLKRTL